VVKTFLEMNLSVRCDWWKVSAQLSVFVSSLGLQYRIKASFQYVQQCLCFGHSDSIIGFLLTLNILLDNSFTCLREDV
jgi:hypothetical protein